MNWIEANGITVATWFSITVAACVVFLTVGMLVHDVWQALKSWRITRRPAAVALHVPEYEEDRFTVYRESGNDRVA